jgi:methionyl-tRNA formyltransferase
VLVCGAEAAGLRALRAAAASGHEVVGVMASPNGEGRTGLGAVWSAARELGYPTWAAELVTDPGFAHTVRREMVDVLLNVHSLYRVHPEVLKSVRVGGFNLHPGPLPRYAGLNAASWAIFRGDREFGVTVHWMEEQIDAGPIAFEASFPIGERDTPPTLVGRCVTMGVPLVLQVLDLAAANPALIPTKPQDGVQREYHGREVPDGGRVQWGRPAEAVANFVRACDYHPFPSPWGQPLTLLRGREIRLLRVVRTGVGVGDVPPGTVAAAGEGELQVACGDEWLIVRRVLVDGRIVRPFEVVSAGDRLE